MRTDDWLVDAAVTPLEDLPVLVDEKVVADVVPAVPFHVVDLDAAHDRGGLRGGVRVRSGRVMHERELKSRGETRRGTANRLVRTPGFATDEERRAGQRNASQRDTHLRAAHEVGAQSLHLSTQSILDPIGRAGPVRVAHVPADRSARFGGPRVREVLALRVRTLPSAPPSCERAGA